MPDKKRRKPKYGKLPPKIVITAPWEVMCVDLISPYTLKDNDGTEIDFMCLTMIDPSSSWFKMVELPVVEIQFSPKAQTETKDAYFDKSSAMISNLANKAWFSRYPRCQRLCMTMEVSSNFTLRHYVNHMALSIS